MYRGVDTVHQEKLLEFLNQLEIPETTNNLIRNYLVQRIVCTSVNRETSEMATVNKGVRQGSVFRPLLYLLYINNMQKIKLKGTYTVYADDTVVLYRGHTRKQMETLINNDMTDTLLKLLTDLNLVWTCSNYKA